MKREISTINNTRSSVGYHFDASEISSEKEKIIDEYCAQAVVPGFRKGKAPRGIILSKFGPDIESRIKSVLANKAFEDAQKSEKELQLLTVVDFSVEQEDTGMVCKLVYDVRPNITLPDYKKIKLTSFETSASDKEINDELNRIKKQHSKYVIVDRKIKSGDYVKVNYDGILGDGSEIAAVIPNHKIWGKQVNTWEEAGNKDVPGVQAVIQGVVGHKVGDKAAGQETFPEDFSIAELAGKKATYNFEILEVRERVDPEINEEFLKQYNVSTLDELKEKIRESIIQHKKTDGLVKQRDEVVDYLAKSTDFELPESVLKHENQVLLQMFVESQLRQGAPVKSFEPHLEEISKSLLPMAGTRGKSGLILDKIAEEENIILENSDVESMIWQDAMIKRININQYINDLKKDRGLLVDLRTRALRGKVLDFILELNSKEAEQVKKENTKKKESTKKAEDAKEKEGTKRPKRENKRSKK